MVPACLFLWPPLAHNLACSHPYLCRHLASTHIQALNLCRHLASTHIQALESMQAPCVYTHPGTWIYAGTLRLHTSRHLNLCRHVASCVDVAARHLHAFRHLRCSRPLNLNASKHPSQHYTLITFTSRIFTCYQLYTCFYPSTWTHQGSFQPDTCSFPDIFWPPSTKTLPGTREEHITKYGLLSICGGAIYLDHSSFAIKCGQRCYQCLSLPLLPFLQKEVNQSREGTHHNLLSMTNLETLFHTAKIKIVLFVCLYVVASLLDVGWVLPFLWLIASPWTQLATQILWSFLIRALLWKLCR